MPRWTPPDTVLAVLRTKPGRVAELFAVAAVRRLAPAVQRRTDWLRDTYPGATDDGLARLAAQEFIRRARTEGAVAGLIGPTGLLAESGVLGWLQAGLVLRIAAAYGHDPALPVRAAELLVLQELYADVGAAEAAIADDSAAPAGRTKVRFALRAAARALAARVLPAPLVGGMTSARLTEQLAIRATSYYKPKGKPTD